MLISALMSLLCLFSPYFYNEIIIEELTIAECGSPKSTYIERFPVWGN